MTVVDVDRVGIACRSDGPEDAPALLLVNSLGTDLSMWDPQIDAFTGHYRVIRHDSRGHGASDVPPGPYTLELLGRDALAVLDAFDVGSACVCGASLGGAIALWLAAHDPDRVVAAVYANTAARIGTPKLWDERIALVEEDGMAAVRDPVLARFFSDRFRARRPDVVERFGQTLERTDPEGYAAACAALRDGDLRPVVAEVTVASLVVAGSEDVPTPPADAEWLHAQLPDSELVVLDGAAHLSSVEQPERFAEVVLDFLRRRSP